MVQGILRAGRRNTPCRQNGRRRCDLTTVRVYKGSVPLHKAVSIFLKKQVQFDKTSSGLSALLCTREPWFSCQISVEWLFQEEAEKGVLLKQTGNK